MFKPLLAFFFCLNPDTAAPHLAKWFSPLGNVGCVLIEPGSWKPDRLVAVGRRAASARFPLTLRVH